jgi:hypothetical protein
VDAIRKLGRGRHSDLQSSQIHFSSSDNTDPRRNGRQYELVLFPKTRCVDETVAESAHPTPLETR